MTTGTLFLILYITQYFFSNFAGVYIRNEFNSYPSYTHITWVEAVYAL